MITPTVRPDLPIHIAPNMSAGAITVPGLWAATELLRRLRGDRPPLAGMARRSVRVRGAPAVIVDDLQRRLPWPAHRVEPGITLFAADELYVELWAQRCDAEISQVTVEARAATPEDAIRVLDQIHEQLRERIVALAEHFHVMWGFRSSRGELVLAGVEEAVTLRLVDAAYPTLHGGVRAFVEDYLDAPECVLVLQGPPGTGKTQLIRAIAAAISRRQERSAEVLYTNDESVLNSDEFFVKFATGDADALVLEDADQRLLARSSGNTELHRMLGVSDGIIRAQGRKMIFSTNLPNVHDLDDALVRPGRCYACLKLRPLRAEETQALLVSICADSDQVQAARRTLGEDRDCGCTVADVYRAARLARRVIEANAPQVRAS